MDRYQRLMLYMMARVLSILLAHHNLARDSADNEIIKEAFGLAFGEPPKEGSRAKGGHARAASLSKARRVEIARKAAEARWRKTDEPTS